jgi:hypothetical protein
MEYSFEEFFVDEGNITPIGWSWGDKLKRWQTVEYAVVINKRWYEMINNIRYVIFDKRRYCIYKPSALI